MGVLETLVFEPREDCTGADAFVADVTRRLACVLVDLAGRRDGLVVQRDHLPLIVQNWRA
jgi:hypothetical protein